MLFAAGIYKLEVIKKKLSEFDKNLDYSKLKNKQKAPIIITNH